MSRSTPTKTSAASSTTTGTANPSLWLTRCFNKREDSERLKNPSTTYNYKMEGQGDREGGEFLRQVRAVLQQRVSPPWSSTPARPATGAEGPEAYHGRYHVSGENPLRDTGISPCPDLSAADKPPRKAAWVQSRTARHRGIAENHPRQPQPCELELVELLTEIMDSRKIDEVDFCFQRHPESLRLPTGQG